MSNLKRYEVIWFNYRACEDHTIRILAKSKWDALRIFYILKVGDIERYKQLVKSVRLYYDSEFITMEDAIEIRKIWEDNK